MVQRIIFADNNLSEVEKIIINLGFQRKKETLGETFLNENHIEASFNDRDSYGMQEYFKRYARASRLSRIYYADYHHNEKGETDDFCNNGILYYKRLLNHLTNPLVITPLGKIIRSEFTLK